ncbi:hypothetical protein [Vibrio phage VCPH]|nr:hypothetical protein [Vibrio phage VCPH]
MTEQEKQILELKAKCFDLTNFGATLKDERDAWQHQTMHVLNILSRVTGIPFAEDDTINMYLEKVGAEYGFEYKENTDE